MAPAHTSELQPLQPAGALSSSAEADAGAYPVTGNGVTSITSRFDLQQQGQPQASSTASAALTQLLQAVRSAAHRALFSLAPGRSWGFQRLPDSGQHDEDDHDDSVDKECEQIESRYGECSDSISSLGIVAVCRVSELYGGRAVVHQSWLDECLPDTGWLSWMCVRPPS